MDATSRAAIVRALRVAVAVLVIAAGCASAQTTAHVSQESLNQFISENRWAEAVKTCERMSVRTADAEHVCGLALANLGRMHEAKEAFLRGRSTYPGDARFAIDLGGVAFREKNYPDAAQWLLRAERMSPSDRYVNEFLGTVFFLDGNTEAALRYWNRVGRPQIENVKIDPKPRLDAVLLDRALAASPGTLLTVDDYLATQQRFKALGVFPLVSTQLEAREDGNFDLAIRAQERHGFGSGKWDALLSMFGSAFFQTITPEYYNIGGSATNVISLWRWDAEKRRVAAEVSGPLRRKAQWRYRVGIDLRNENWDVENFSAVPEQTLGFLNTRRSAGFVEVRSISSGRWNWSTGGEISYRDYRSVAADSPLGASLLLQGYQLKHFFRTDYDLVRMPERHYFATAFGSSQVGRVWAESNPIFAKFQGGVRQRWSTNAKGDDYEFTHELRGGRTAGDVPFDELFMLGLERDNDLKLRAHIGTRDGQKGSAPLGRNYLISNLDFDKKIWGDGLVRFSVGPFLDAGKIGDPLQYLGSREWLVDTGAQIKMRVIGVTITTTYGRDLRGGRDAFYATVGR